MLVEISSYLAAGARKYPFLCAFAALALVEAWVWPPEFSIRDVDGVLAGIATMNDLDVAARVGFFYTTLAGLALTFLAFAAALGWAHLELPRVARHSPVLNYLGFFGMTMLVAELLGNPSGASLQLAVAAITGLLVVLVPRTAQPEQAFDLDTLMFFGLTALAASVALGNVTSLLDLPAIPSVLTFAATAISLLALKQLGRLEASGNWVVRCRLLYCLPLLYVAAVEGFLVLNQRSIYLGSPLLLFGIGSVLLGLLFWARASRRTAGVLDRSRELARFSIPVVLAGVTAQASYSPIWEQSRKLFEPANQANAVMRWFEWGEIPFLENLSSHLLSDLALPFLYVWLNGYSGQPDFYVYAFLLQMISAVIAYFFLLSVFQQVWMPLYLVLFFPLFGVLFPLDYVLALVSVFLLNRLFREYRFGLLAAVLAWSFFLLIWRVDTGVANLAATLTLLTVHGIRHRNPRLLVDTTAATALVVAIPIAAYLGLAHVKGISPLEPVRMALEYIGASQAHGLVEFARESDRTFVYQYVFFPVALLIGWVVLVARFSEFHRRNPFLAVSLLYLVAFYFANAQRGLVRHGLAAGTDVALTSFLYLIVPLGFLLFTRRAGAIACAGFVAVASFAVQDFATPRRVHESVYERFARARIDPQLLRARERIPRLRPARGFAKRNFLEFERFLNESVAAEATFLDFSNSPMLYFYLGRRVPSYFNQYLQNTVTGYLQDRNIERLEELDVPVVIFANHPKRWGDHIDGVPNTLRHDRLASYIFANYSPFALIDARQIWIRHGISPAPRWASPEMPGLALEPEMTNLIRLPAVLGRDRSMRFSTVETRTPVASRELRFRFTREPQSKEQFLELQIESGKTSCTSTLTYRNGREAPSGFLFDVSASTNTERYLIPLSTQYNWFVARGVLDLEIHGCAAPRVESISLLDKER